jgi:hypothetical protein
MKTIIILDQNDPTDLLPTHARYADLVIRKINSLFHLIKSRDLLPGQLINLEDVYKIIKSYLETTINIQFTGDELKMIHKLMILDPNPHPGYWTDSEWRILCGIKSKLPK